MPERGRYFSTSVAILVCAPLYTSATIVRVPPGFRTLNISVIPAGRSGHQKCVSTAVTRSNVFSRNGSCETEASIISTRPEASHGLLVLGGTEMLSGG